MLPLAIWVFSLLKYTLKSANQEWMVILGCSCSNALIAAWVSLLREAGPQKESCMVSLAAPVEELPQPARSSKVRPARPLSPIWQNCLRVYEIRLITIVPPCVCIKHASVPTIGRADDDNYLE